MTLPRALALTLLAIALVGFVPQALSAGSPAGAPAGTKAAAPSSDDDLTDEEAAALGSADTQTIEQAIQQLVSSANTSDIMMNAVRPQIRATEALVNQAEDAQSHIVAANATLVAAQKALQTTASAAASTSTQDVNVSSVFPTVPAFGRPLTASQRNPPAKEVANRFAGQREAFQGPVAFHEISISEVITTVEGEMGFFSLYPANTLFFPTNLNQEDIKELRLDFLDYLAKMGIHASDAVRDADPNTITFAYTQQRPAGGVELLPSLTGPAATAFISPINRDIRNLKGQVYPRTGITEVDNHVYRVVEGGFSLILLQPIFVGGDIGLVPAGPGYFNTLVSWENKDAKPPYDRLQTVSYGALVPVVWPLANTVFYKKPYKNNWPFGNGTAWAAGQATQVQPLGYQITLTGIEQFSPGPAFPALSNAMLPHVLDG